MLGISTTNLRVNGFRGGIDADAQSIYNRIIADSGVSNLSRLNYLVKGLKTIYGSLSNTPVCYDAHWIGYQPANGVGATSGQACSKLYSLTVAGDAIQATASQQPLLLAHNGAVTDNYWYGSGVGGNILSSTVSYNTSTIEIEATFSLNVTTGQPNIVSGGNGTNSSFFFFYDLSLSAIVFQYYTAGFKSAFALTSFTNLDTFYILRNAITGAITIKKNGTTLTTLNSQVAGALDYSITQVKVGEGNCKVNRAKLFIAGTTVIDCNPASYNAATSQTQWTSSTGELWTINTGAATTGYKGVLVDRTIVQSDGVDDIMAQSTANRGDICTQYLSAKYAAVATAGASFIDAQSHASYNSISWLNSTTIRAYQENATLIDRNVIAQSLNLITLTNTNGAQTMSINNGINGTNNQNPSASKTGITLMANGASGARQQGFLNTYLCANSVNDSTTRTAMYNFIKTLNNNAF